MKQYNVYVTVTRRLSKKIAADSREAAVMAATEIVENDIGSMRLEGESVELESVEVMDDGE